MTRGDTTSRITKDEDDLFQEWKLMDLMRPKGALNSAPWNSVSLLKFASGRPGQHIIFSSFRLFFKKSLERRKVAVNIRELRSGTLKDDVSKWFYGLWGFDNS